eukprot:3871918-Amphidinium_carterae.1
MTLFTAANAKLESLFQLILHVRANELFPMPAISFLDRFNNMTLHMKHSTLKWKQSTDWAG